MIALDTRTKGRMTFACVLLTPVIAVQGARFLLGPQAGPAAASAAIAPGPPGVPASLVPAPLKPFTPAQQRASDWLVARASPASMRSPMDHGSSLRPTVPDAPPAQAPADSPAPEADTPDPTATPSLDLPRLTLTGLLVNGRTRVAALNHRIFRVGDTVVPGWRVSLIDSRSRSVTLVGPGGRTAVFQTPPPTLNTLPPLTNSTDRGPLKP